MIEIRPARVEDASTLFEWRNDALTCAMSHNAEPVTWETHLAWVNRRLTRAEPHLYVAVDRGQPVGTFRIDDDEISYTVAPCCRGRGVGTEMLRQARAMFGPKRADIYDRNPASIKIAERAGMIVRVLHSD